MPNPFEQRATEYLRDDEAFLAVVTPEPLAAFFQKPAAEGRLFDRLTLIVGTPGSGKTTLARLFEFPTISTLLRKQSMTEYRPLLDMLTECGGIRKNQPAVVGTRVPMESEYRELWDMPYPVEIKNRFLIGLLQARAVLSWIRKLEASGVPLDDIRVIPRQDAQAGLRAIGGTSGEDVFARARAIELAIYKVSAALLAPPLESVGPDATAAYRPFDVIEALGIRSDPTVLHLRPLVILDDAHTLHNEQFAFVRQWLTRRELRVSRWLLTRLDALAPSDVLAETPGVGHDSGFDRARDVTRISMQDRGRRRYDRVLFRRMAADMASRYLAQMPTFGRRRLNSLADLLATDPEPITGARLVELRTHVTDLRRRYGITERRHADFESRVRRHLRNAVDASEDLELAMLSILYERYARRTRGGSLFGDAVDPDPRRPILVDGSVADGARIQLHHKYGRPYYFGIETLSDASSENAEQFLRLSARLVAQLETRLIRRTGSATLKSREQHKLLVERATELVHDWDFPESSLVRRLAERIARDCRARTLEGSAPLGAGANAVGVPQEEFNILVEKDIRLARVLKFGVAYNAFSVLPNHGTKNRAWCLIELGGVTIVRFGLTLKRGGFVERRAIDLRQFLSSRDDG